MSACACRRRSYPLSGAPRSRGSNASKNSINRILASLIPDHGLITGTSLGSHQAGLKHVRRAQLLMTSYGVIEDDKGESNLRFQSLQDLVWMPATDHWDAGRYRSAA
jgi:hypothetical protein